VGNQPNRQQESLVRVCGGKEKTMNEHELDQIFDQLLEANCPCEMSDLLSPLSNDDLNAVYEDFLVQYSQELALGALERSEWFCGNLIINANQPSICFTRTALDVMRHEIETRKIAAAEPDQRRRAENICSGLPILNSADR
jgi:hypothetical protein